MNKMNEDEALNILKTMCTDNFCIEQLKTKQAIETILDLYKQEKDSNQWLLKAFDESRNNNIELAKEYYKLQEELKQEKEENKDKIREKIKKLEKEQKEYKGSQEWEILDVINAQIDVLKELLEEE